MNGSLPDPIVFPPSQYWDGNDGPWSSFFIRVGTPPQYVRVLPATAGQYSWVVLPEGCSPAVFNSSVCGESRGELLNISQSKSWQDQGNGNFYGLDLGTNLGYSGNGDFGLETVGLGLQGLPAVGGPDLPSQVVAGIATTDFFMGGFGLGVQPTNFSTFGDPKPSFVASLKASGLIPSLSWAYTAGAKYRLKGAFGSLTIGGYDLSRFIPNNVSFNLAPDISRDLVVGIQSINSVGTNGEPLPLLPSGVFAFVDSTVPHIWLPLDACQAFEQAFGLTWNETIELYTRNDTAGTTLAARNASITFRLGNALSGGPVVDIVLPGSSFDLTVGPPLMDNATKYFPLKRATNSTQYTLGRTFLQEAYLVADYERSNFSISQCLFQDGAKENIIPILPQGYKQPVPSDQTNPTAKRFGIGALVGVILGGVVILLLSLLWVYKRRKRPVPPKPICSPDPEVAVPSRTSTEMIEELQGDNAVELGGASVSELPGDMPLQHELPLPVYELPIRVPLNSHHTARIFRNQTLARLGMVDHVRVESHRAEVGVLTPRGTPSRDMGCAHMGDGREEQHAEPRSLNNTHDGHEDLRISPLNIENGRKRRLEKQRQSSASARSASEQALTNGEARSLP